MRFSKGTVKNINKKILSGALCLTLLTTGLAGCSDLSNNFKYIKNEQGVVVSVDGTVGYDYLKNCYFTVIEDRNFETIKFYITKRYIDDPTLVESKQKYCYIDILTNKEIFKRREDAITEYADEKNNKFLMTEIKLEDYLYDLEKIQDNYTNEDVEEILEIMKKNLLDLNNKQLVKEK